MGWGALDSDEQQLVLLQSGRDLLLRRRNSLFDDRLLLVRRGFGIF